MGIIISFFVTAQLYSHVVLLVQSSLAAATKTCIMNFCVPTVAKKHDKIPPTNTSTFSQAPLRVCRRPSKLAWKKELGSQKSRAFFEP